MARRPTAEEIAKMTKEEIIEFVRALLLRPTSTEEVAGMFKALVRPYLIISGWTTWLILVATGGEVPVLLAGVVGAITGEYGLERMVKRWKEIPKGK